MKLSIALLVLTAAAIGEWGWGGAGERARGRGGVKDGGAAAPARPRGQGGRRERCLACGLAPHTHQPTQVLAWSLLTGPTARARGGVCAGSTAPRTRAAPRAQKKRKKVGPRGPPLPLLSPLSPAPAHHFSLSSLSPSPTAITQSSVAHPAGFLTRRRLAQAASAPAPADLPLLSSQPFPMGGDGDATRPPADDPAGASDLAARLSQTMSPAEICAAAKEIYGSTPPQCAGVATEGTVKKVRDVPVKVGPLDARDTNNDGTVDVLDGPINVAPLTSGVEVGRAGRALAAAMAGVAAGSLLLL